MPINTLKIDRFFIINIVNNVDHRTIVSTIASQAHSLKHKVIAERIDAEEPVKLRQEMVRDEFQGYFFTRPISAETSLRFGKEFLSKLGNGNDRHL